MTDTINWLAVRPGDPAPIPLGLLMSSGLEPCGATSTGGPFPFLCSRPRHQGGVHAAIGLTDIVLATWGPGWFETIEG